jgi:hypothetical protein
MLPSKNLLVTFRWAYCRFIEAFAEKELPDISAKMTFTRPLFGGFARVSLERFVTNPHCLIQQADRPPLKQSFNHFIIIRLPLLPNLVKICFRNITHNYPAASPAENIAERVDVNALCA